MRKKFGRKGVSRPVRRSKKLEDEKNTSLKSALKPAEIDTNEFDFIELELSELKPVPKPKKREPSVMSMALYTAAGVSGLAMFGIHRFYARGLWSGLKYLGIVFLLGSIAITIGVQEGEQFDTYGRIIWNIMTLICVYACLEALCWGGWEAFRLNR